MSLRPRYSRWVALLLVAVAVLAAINAAVTKPSADAGIAPGERMPPFAVPLAASALTGDADIATKPDQGAAGMVPACHERGGPILNVCQLYEQGPVVLALFVDSGSCANVLSEMQSLVGEFPGVRFAAVSIKGSRSALRATIRRRRLSFPVGIDEDGALVALYKLASCPQVTFAYPGGAVQSKALLNLPSAPALRARVAALVADARARGWKQAGRA